MAEDLVATPDVKRGEGVAHVLGGGSGLWDDIRTATEAHGAPAVAFSVNSAAMLVYSDHLVSAHAKLLPHMRKGAPGDPVTHTILAGQDPEQARECADIVWTGQNSGGTSSLIAARIALAMGYGPVLLCGVPLEPCGYAMGYRQWTRDSDRVLRKNDPRNSGTLEGWRAAWVRARDAGYLENVFSTSGFTRGLLGWPQTI